MHEIWRYRNKQQLSGAPIGNPFSTHRRLALIISANPRINWPRHAINAAMSPRHALCHWRPIPRVQSQLTHLSLHSRPARRAVTKGPLPPPPPRRRPLPLLSAQACPPNLSFSTSRLSLATRAVLTHRTPCRRRLHHRTLKNHLRPIPAGSVHTTPSTTPLIPFSGLDNIVVTLLHFFFSTQSACPDLFPVLPSLPPPPSLLPSRCTTSAPPSSVLLPTQVPH